MVIESRAVEIEGNRYIFRILGDEYTIKGTGDPAYVERVASYLEQNIIEVTQSNSKLTKTQSVVLAALRIADELHKLRQEYDYLDELLREVK